MMIELILVNAKWRGLWLLDEIMKYDPKAGQMAIVGCGVIITPTPTV
jgi:hypothetical protein